MEIMIRLLWYGDDDKVLRYGDDFEVDALF